MASLSTFSNFLTFLFPPKSQPPPPPPLPPLPPPPNLTIRKPLHHVTPLDHSDQDPPYSCSSSPSSLSSVVCPSLAQANTMWFKSTYNVEVAVEENEPEERLLNRFRREVMKAGVIQECRRRRYHEDTQDKRKRKSREAAKRNRRRRPQLKSLAENKQAIKETKKKDDDDDDNWDLPEDNAYIDHF
ncbi:hypothetical protein HN51_033164 [Arachis hypogaea]|uniref:Uncharacterized protein n=1 Tax=Arachis hypogaea TaxID=3818 RepID=A0A445B1X9_ARAHY|nr:30S ribosomal protein S21, chloroplastic [Arachis hypogaea]QHO17621.1 30S ribosomal protein [Arachis hypogaea]RYR32659.1 hypothetical protein Ahy_A10g047193 [Arachis hypogaea]